MMRHNGKAKQARKTLPRKSSPKQSPRKRERVLLGRYIVSDSGICHGKPTFRGTRIMVWQVLEMVSDGYAWETIVEECHNNITKDAIAEAVKLSSEAFLKHSREFAIERVAV